MNRFKSEDNEVMYLDEVHEEISRPLTSVDTEVAPAIRSRAGSLTKTDNQDNPRSIPRSEIDDLQPAEKSSIGFDNGFLLERPVSPGWHDERDILPQQPLPVTPDVNIYQHKKTLAQGMMDLALLSANANQMRYVLQTDGRHPYFYPSLTMIGMSLFLQIAVGIGLIWNSQYNVKEHEQMCKANKANNWTVIGIFLVTILNVFISSFGVVDQAQTTAVVTT